MNVFEWVDSYSGAGWFWYAKRLAGNDTLATRAHQAGPYLPKSVYLKLFPSLATSPELNPRLTRMILATP